MIKVHGPNDQYDCLVKYIFKHGKEQTVRGHKSFNVANICFNYMPTDSFPIITSKKVAWKMAINEILGYLRGYTSARDFREKLDVPTWNANANADWWQESHHCVGPDDMGEVYGAVWRNWDGDQLHEVVTALLEKRYNRRLVLSCWDQSRLDKACLYPCMYSHTFVVSGDTLNMVSNQRKL